MRPAQEIKQASSLSYLGFQLAQPCQVLRPYVREYWAFCRDTPLFTYHEEYMHPRGGYGIVFNFGDAIRFDTHHQAVEPVLLDGANTVSRRVGFTGQVDLLGIRFYEGGAYPFLGIPLQHLRNETVLLDAVDQHELWALRTLHARLAEATTLPARVRLLDEWLLGRLTRGKARSALIPASLAMLRQLVSSQQTGSLPIPELAQSLAVSQRQLERLYQSQVGMSPKQYAQLLRIDAARSALKRIQPLTTAGIAADFGFYDQAHFIREFSAVVGMTPYAYQLRNRQKSTPA